MKYLVFFMYESNEFLLENVRFFNIVVYIFKIISLLEFINYIMELILN